ncbi:MAG: hypothetical protein DHS20C18_43700 [Saprospiraceae bacterium]|nr:MAG: hypothetical protein DHS20C18_43700 [Saprospiraceae bacterium]
MKRTTGKLFLVSFLWLLSNLPAKAQISLFFNDQEAYPSTIVYADLKVNDFTNILGAQFSVHWDPTILLFKTVEHLGIEDMNLEGNFGTTAVNEGRMGFLWYDESLQGVSLEDSSILFSIKFEVIGSPFSATEIVFANQPSSIEISDVDDVLNADLVAGNVSVQSPTSTVFNTAPDKIKVEDSFPNPFNTSTQISFSLRNATTIQFTVTDISGKVIFEETQPYSNGTHAIDLPESIFPESGAYYYRMRSKDFTVSQKLIHIKNR